MGCLKIIGSVMAYVLLAIVISFLLLWAGSFLSHGGDEPVRASVGFVLCLVASVLLLKGTVERFF